MKNDYNERLLGMLGLAARARMVQCGAELACECVRTGKAKLLIVSGDASTNTRKRVFNCAEYYETACYQVPIAQARLGQCVGKSGTTAALALTDCNMANGITKLLKQMNAQTSKAVSKPREV